MSDELKCLRCGGTNLAPGTVQASGSLRFRPDNTKFWTLETGDVAIQSFMCTDCGTVTLLGDVDKEKRLTE